MLSPEQKSALDVVAKAFGWDRMTLDQIRLLAWAAFHYYANRLPGKTVWEHETSNPP